MNPASYPKPVQDQIDGIKKVVGEDKTVFAAKMGQSKGTSLDFLDSLRAKHGPDLTSVGPPVELGSEDSSATRYVFFVVGMGKEGSYIEPVDSANFKFSAIVEEHPEPIPGMDSLMNQIEANLQYPAKAKKEGIEGVVHVLFTSNADGSLSDMEVKKSLGYGCDEEAMRAIKLTSKDNWKPAQHLGEPVKMKMVLPIVFELPEE